MKTTFLELPSFINDNMDPPRTEIVLGRKFTDFGEFTNLLYDKEKQGFTEILIYMFQWIEPTFTEVGGEFYKQIPKERYLMVRCQFIK